MTILVAAGGTGGHLFPAIAVVDSILESHPTTKFHFFGKKKKIEGRVVPALGFKLHRSLIFGLKKITALSNIILLILIPIDIFRVYRLIKRKKIDAVICTGAYISFPAGMAAHICKKPLFLLESNVNPGKTIGIIARYATALFTSFAETKEYFSEEYFSIIKHYGNPIRKEIVKAASKYNDDTREECLAQFQLKKDKPVVFVFGGSLGASSINNCIVNSIERVAKSDYQILWQTGSSYDNSLPLPSNIKQFTFIDDMAAAYSIADIVVCRSGASTLSELCVSGKASILIPLPSASNNEQFHNAEFLAKNDAAIIIDDQEINEKLIDTIEKLIMDKDRISKMSNIAKELAITDAAKNISDEIMKTICNDDK
jgi:UDP-N-acetylglucosamine--N-acetylmuramyl-(pentapeptide) pyrophosphoryl-undecaprenol N-acetylglucosamine transferase